MDKILRDKKAIFVFIAPALIMFLLVLIIPTIQMVYYSLCDYAALTPPEFVGLKNYKKLFFGDATFRIALKNSIYYLPCVLSSAALGLLWSFLFNPRIGINNLLAKFGIEGPLWLMDSTGFIVLPMWVIAFVALWQYLGQNMMLYMAQITGISRDIYEASYIDGASKVKAFRYITLPLIKPMMITSLSLNCIGSLKFFDLVYNMTQGGPNHRTEVLATELYAEGFNYFKYGYASAISVVLLVLCLLVTLLVKKVIKVETYES